MSARLKLKNAKRMMDAMHAHCEKQIFKAKVKEAECHRLLFENIIQLGIDVQMTPVEILSSANSCLKYNVKAAAHKIADEWAKGLEEYISGKLEREYRIDHFSRLRIRVFVPRPNDNHVKVIVKELYG